MIPREILKPPLESFFREAAGHGKLYMFMSVLGWSR